MRIVRTAAFVKSLKRLGASAEDLSRLEDRLAADPEAGDVIPGLGGARKIRFGLRGKGKRGGGRAIYIVLWKDDEVFLSLAYSKSDQSDLSRSQWELVKGLVKELSDG